MSKLNIPPAALEAGARAMCHNAYKHLPEMRDQDTYTPDADYWLDQARAAFVAMVEAWPGSFEEYMNVEEGRAVVCMILPKGGDDD